MSDIDWTARGDYQDILYAKADGIAKITINRPHRRNAFTPLTVEEMMHALDDARRDQEVGVVILTGQGDLAFCSGGDQKIRGDAGYRDTGGDDRLNVLEFQRQIRTCPKPIVAMVAGYAIGGGHVLHVMCDLTIAADNAIFGQTGPKVGSFDGGYGSAYLARIVGQKKAREIWFLCRQYDAQAGAGDGAGEHRGAARRVGAGDGALVPRHAGALAHRPALPEGRPQRRLRRPGRIAGAGRIGDHAVLPDGGSAGGPRLVRREAHARLQQVPPPLLRVSHSPC